MRAKEEIVRMMPGRIGEALQALSPEVWQEAEEIRMRQGQALYLRCGRTCWYVHPQGRVRKTAYGALMVTAGEIQSAVEKMAGYGRFAHIDELRQGYLTLPGGHRVGLSGRAVTEGAKVLDLRQVTGLVIRCAKEVKQCGATVFDQLWEEGELQSTLILSPPGWGKTTLLRDLVRRISNAGLETVVVDERREICPMGPDGRQMDLGIHTDVLEGCPKEKGIWIALRTLGPEVLAVDELAGAGELCAVQNAACCGVRLLCTCHGENLLELAHRTGFAAVLTEGIFRRMVVLGPGHLARVYDEGGRPITNEEERDGL